MRQTDGTVVTTNLERNRTSSPHYMLPQPPDIYIFQMYELYDFTSIKEMSESYRHHPSRNIYLKVQDLGR